MAKGWVYLVHLNGDTKKGYTGATKHPSVRLAQHLSSKQDTYASRWMKKCVRDGMELVMDLLEECEWEDLAWLEMAWIKHLKEEGYTLVNTTGGGNGLVGVPEDVLFDVGRAQRGKYWKHSQEKIEKHSARLAGNRYRRGKVWSEAERENRWISELTNTSKWRLLSYVGEPSWCKIDFYMGLTREERVAAQEVINYRKRELLVFAGDI